MVVMSGGQCPGLSVPTLRFRSEVLDIFPWKPLISLCNGGGYTEVFFKSTESIGLLSVA